MLKLLLFAMVLHAQPLRESIEWCDAWIPNMKSNDLPRVMLIGDSITRGYYGGVEAKLKGKAYVARIATSKAIGDPALLDEVRVFVTQARFDIVHFNVGMHGWEYSEAEYAKHLGDVVKTIRKSAPKARLIWAHTTPIRKDSAKGASNSRIAERNRIAQAYFERRHIPIDNLHSLMHPYPELHSDDVHFNKDGNELLASQVAAEVSKLLQAR